MPIRLKDLTALIEVTDWVQTPTGEAEVDDSRIPLFEAYAKVENASSYRINNWRADIRDRDTVTHIFTIREPCDYEIGCQNWIFREYRGRREWYRIHGVKDIEEGYHCYIAIAASLYVRDSDRIDEETQDVPCEDIEPDAAKYDFRDVGW